MNASKLSAVKKLSVGVCFGLATVLASAEDKVIDGPYVVAAEGEAYDNVTLAPGADLTGGPLTINAGGTLTFSGRGLPGTLPAIVQNCKWHFDASRVDKMEFMGTERYGRPCVKKWIDARKGAMVGAQEMTATDSRSSAPTLADDCFAGLTCMDMSVHGATTYWSGPAMMFANTLVRDFFMVVADADGGNLAFISEWGKNHGQRNGYTFANEWTASQIRNGLIEVDGETKQLTDEYPKGFHVLHMCLSSGITFNALATANDNAFGTKKYGEIIIFDSVRSAEEVQGITDFLTKKWQGAKVGKLVLDAGATVTLADGARGLVGLLKTTDSVTSAAAVTVDVAAGSCFQVRQMNNGSTGKTLQKTGAGEMLLPRGGIKGGLVSKAGAVTATDNGWGAGTLSDAVKRQAETLLSASRLHLDASVESSLVMTNGTYCSCPLVAQWNDVRGANVNYAYQDGVTGELFGGGGHANQKTAPYLSAGNVPGMKIVDFGDANYKGSMKIKTTLAVREAFIVCEDVNGQTFLSSSTHDGWQRSGADHPIGWTWTDAKIRGGLIEIDGEPKAYTDVFPAGLHVLRLQLTGQVTADALGFYNWTSTGGMRYGEIATFDSPLADADAKAITAYLLEKWRGGSLKNVTLSEGATVKVAKDAKLAVMKLTTEGGALEVAETAALTVADCTDVASVAKTGDGTAVLGDGADAVAVDAGQLTLAPSRALQTIPSAASKAKLHLDASSAASLVSAGTTKYDKPQVSQWNDVRGVAVGKAYFDPNRGNKNGCAPWISADRFVGLPYMDMSIPGATASWSGPTMSFATIAVREFFMVAADGEGGTTPFISSVGLSTDSSWQGRPGFGNQWASAYYANAFVEVDGVQQEPSVAYPAGFHVLHLRLTGNLNANALAAYSTNQYGTKKYGEILIFDAALSDAEAKEINDYLIKKWKVKTDEELAKVVAVGETIAEDVSVGSAAVAEGARLVAAGGGVYAEVKAVVTPTDGVFAAEEGSVLALPANASVGQLAGKGKIAGDFTANGIAALSADDLPVRVLGSLTLGSNFAFDLTALETAAKEGDAFTLAEATSVSGSPCEFKSGIKGLWWSVEPNGTSVKASLFRKGTVIVIR